MRWLTVLATLGLSACAGAAKQQIHGLYYHGHCVKALIGGRDFLADCSGTLATLEYPSDLYAISFLLTGDRQVIFLLSKDPAVHPADSSFVTNRAALVTGSDEHDYETVAVVCNQTRETPVPKFFECIGQAEGQSAFFSFETDGTPPVVGKD